MSSAPLTNFSKGELGPELYSRIDTPQYAAALKLARNFLVQKYGGATFRPGTRVVGKIDDPDGAHRMFPFQFSIEQGYVLLFQQGMMRPIALGGFVIEQNTQIIGATLGPTTILEIPFHGYEAGNRIYLSGITGTVELNGRIVTVTSVPDADHIVIDLDSTGFTPFSASDGTLNSGPPPAPPAPPPVPAPPPSPPPPSTTDPRFDYEWRYGGYPPWYIPPEF